MHYIYRHERDILPLLARSITLADAPPHCTILRVLLAAFVQFASTRIRAAHWHFRTNFIVLPPFVLNNGSSSLYVAHSDSLVTRAALICLPCAFLSPINICIHVSSSSMHGNFPAEMPIFIILLKTKSSIPSELKKTVGAMSPFTQAILQTIRSRKELYQKKKQRRKEKPKRVWSRL